MPKSEVVTIFVYLPSEAVDAWASATAEHIEGDVYRIVSGPPAEDEPEFGEGAFVYCRLRALAGPGRETSDVLVAYKKMGI